MLIACILAASGSWGWHKKKTRLEHRQHYPTPVEDISCFFVTPSRSTLTDSNINYLRFVVAGSVRRTAPAPPSKMTTSVSSRPEAKKYILNAPVLQRENVEIHLPTQPTLLLVIDRVFVGTQTSRRENTNTTEEERKGGTQGRKTNKTQKKEEKPNFFLTNETKTHQESKQSSLFRESSFGPSLRTYSTCHPLHAYGNQAHTTHREANFVPVKFFGSRAHARACHNLCIAHPTPVRAGSSASSRMTHAGPTLFSTIQA